MSIADRIRARVFVHDSDAALFGDIARDVASLEAENGRLTSELAEARAALEQERSAHQLEKRAHELTWDTKARVIDERDVARARIVALEAENERLRRNLASLLDQIECHGCVAARDGERTYECNAEAPCGLCRLRAMVPSEEEVEQIEEASSLGGLPAVRAYLARLAAAKEADRGDV